MIPTDLTNMKAFIRIAVPATAGQPYREPGYALEFCPGENACIATDVLTDAAISIPMNGASNMIRLFQLAIRHNAGEAQ